MPHGNLSKFFSAWFKRAMEQMAITFRGTKRVLAQALQIVGSKKRQSQPYLFSAWKTSLTSHLSRFKRCSSVLSVTFCSPISIRCKDEEEMPSLRAKAGKLNCPRRFLKNRPSRVCIDAAMPSVCIDPFPTCGKSCLTHILELIFVGGRNHLFSGRNSVESRQSIFRFRRGISGL